MMLGQADLNTFAQVIPYIGVPGAMLLVALFAIWKKWFVPGWVLADQNESHSRELEYVVGQRNELQRKCDALDQQGRDDAKRYLDVILRQQGIAQAAVSTALKAAGGDANVKQP